MSPRTGEVLLRLVGRGHPAIRGTHGKTLEFAADSDITARATCVIGVGARWEGPSAPVIAGPVRLRLDAGGEVVTVHAVANPAWQPSHGIIVRRSGNRFGDTLAADADAGAADLPREFVARLHDPDTELQVTVERAAGRATAVLLGSADRPQRLPRLLAECAAADLIVAEDDTASALLRSHGFQAHVSLGGAAPRRRPLQRPDDGLGLAGAQAGAATAQAARTTPTGPDPRVAGAIAAGSRVLVVAAEALPGTSAYLSMDEPGDLVIEVAGLPPSLAVAAASPSRAPVMVLDAAPPRELRSLIRQAPPAARVVFRAQAGGLPALCRAPGGARPTHRVTVVREAPSQAERVLRLPPDQLAGSLPPKERVVCCLDAAPGSPLPGEEHVRQLAAALTREGVSTRTLAAALAELPGWSRNQAYEFASGVAAGPDRER